MTHRCSNPACLARAAGTTLVRQQLCQTHLEQWKCTTPDCPRQRTHRSEQLPFCSHHIICTEVSCEKLRQTSGRFCSAHTCSRAGCDRYVRWEHMSCELHTCRAFMDKEGRKPCALPTIPFTQGREPVWLDYCAAHICQLSIRTSEMCANGNDNRTYCDQHRCTAPKCDHGRLIDPQDTHMTSSTQVCTCHQAQGSPFLRKLRGERVI